MHVSISKHEVLTGELVQRPGEASEASREHHKVVAHGEQVGDTERLVEGVVAGVAQPQERGALPL